MLVVLGILALADGVIADNVHYDNLTFEFVPSKDADVIIYDLI